MELEQQDEDLDEVPTNRPQQQEPRSQNFDPATAKLARETPGNCESPVDPVAVAFTASERFASRHFAPKTTGRRRINGPGIAWWSSAARGRRGRGACAVGAVTGPEAEATRFRKLHGKLTARTQRTIRAYERPHRRERPERAQGRFWTTSRLPAHLLPGESISKVSKAIRPFAASSGNQSIAPNCTGSVAEPMPSSFVC